MCTSRFANSIRRKKFKRLFEKDDTPLALSGTTLGNGETGTQATRTPKTKAAKEADDEVEVLTPAAKPKSAAKKRTTTDVIEEDENVLEKAEESATPKKKAKITKTPKSPKTPKTPRAPRTPKGTGVDSPKHQENKKSTDSLENGTMRTGSPEVQAKVDGIVEHNEKNGVEVGEAEKQAIHDGVEKELVVSEKE